MEDVKRLKFHAVDREGYWILPEVIAADYPSHPMKESYVDASDYAALEAKLERTRAEMNGVKVRLERLKKQFGVETEGGCYCYNPKIKFGAGNAADIEMALHGISLIERETALTASTTEPKESA